MFTADTLNCFLCIVSQCLHCQLPLTLYSHPPIHYTMFFIGYVLNKFSRNNFFNTCLNFVEQISHIIYIPSVITYSTAVNLLATSYLDVNLTM